MFKMRACFRNPCRGSGWGHHLVPVSRSGHGSVTSLGLDRAPSHRQVGGVLRTWWIGLVTGCTAVAEPAPPSQPEGWRDEVSLATRPDLDPSRDVVEVTLEAKVTGVEVWPGVVTELWTYEGVVPGPILRGKKGGRLVVHFTNHLPEPTTIHWHGLRVPAAMDGTEAVQTPIAPGESFDYDLPLLDAGTYWYHPHVRSSAQVGYGLYGMLIVDDDTEPMHLGDELPLVFSDLGLDEGGVVRPGDENGWFGDYFGREGNLLLINGRVRPKVKARAGLPQRWRLVNAARSRYLKLVAPGVEVVQIGSDGGLIEAPRPLDAVVLAPGERMEVVATAPFAGVGRIPVRWEDTDRFHIGTPQAALPLFDLEVGPEAAVEVEPLPERLRDVPELDLSQALPRTIELTEMVEEGVGVLGINGVAGSHAELFHAHVGSTEVWTVENRTGYDHPFHLHGFFFQPLMADRRPWPNREWKDTLHIPAHSRLDFAVSYDDRPGMWMFHCHILDHADLGMMAMLMVERPHQ